MNRIILLGAPGSGKGTQAQRLCEKLGVKPIATGDILRAAVNAQTELGREAQRYMNAGELVPDATMIGIISARLAEPDCQAGFLLDGFPRTVAQAEALGELVELDHVIELRCSPELLERRLVGRRVHQASGRTYHVEFAPPKQEGLDDATGEPLIQRADDRPATVANRLKVYAAQTRPLIDYYSAHRGAPQFHILDADRSISEVTAALLAVFADA